MTQERHSLLLPWIIFNGIILAAGTYAYVKKFLLELFDWNINCFKYIFPLILFGEYI